MDPFIWLVLALLAIYLFFATAESATRFLSSFKLQLILDSCCQRSALSRWFLPRDQGAMREILSFGRIISLAVLVFFIPAIMSLPVPIWLAIIIAVAVIGLYLPSALAVLNPQGIINVLLPLIMITNIIVLPLSWPVLTLLHSSKKRMRERGFEMEEEEEAQQIEAYIDTAQEEGLLEPGEAELVKQVVEFGETVVREVMTPRVDMICVDRDATLQEFIKLAGVHKFSRFPVIEGMIDNVVGVANIKKLLTFSAEELETKSVAEIMNLPFFAPESKYVHSLLRDFQQNKQQMAIVVDEYGGTAGLITLEDILEEIVGEIEDEHEEEEEEIVQEPDGALVVAGYVDVDEVEELLGLRLDDEAYETVSGMALSHLKHFPKAGEKFITRGVEVEILEANEKSILRLRMKKVDEDDDDE